MNDAIINLNKAYAKRIIDWCLEQHEPLTEHNIKKVISKVERDFGREIKIETKSEFNFKKNLNQIKQILQEDISIQTINS